MSLVGFRSKNHPQQVRARGADLFTDERITPPEIYDPLYSKYFFTLDVAASQSNTKCRRFYTIETDGLSQSWAYESVWCNPPYSDIGAWVRKAREEVLGGECKVAVMLLPANRCEQSWWQSYIEPFRDGGGHPTVRTTFLGGRPRFGWPDGRVTPAKGDRPPFGLVVVAIQK